MNLNSLAIEICKREGKKKSTDIAQVKEVLKVTIEILKDQSFLVQQDLSRYIEILVDYAHLIQIVYLRQDPKILVPAPVMQVCKINKKGNVLAKKKPKAKRKLKNK